MPALEIQTKARPEPTAEGVILGFAITNVHILPFLLPPLTHALEKGLRHIPAEAMEEGALGIFVGALLLGYIYEVETLKKLGLTSNPFTTMTYFKIKNPELATAIGDLLGQIAHSLSPVDLGYVVASLASQDRGHLFFSYLIARSVLGFGFVTGFNWALRQGHADKIVSKIHEGRRVLTETIDGQLARFGIFALDEALFPPQPLDYPDNTSGDFHNKYPLNPSKNAATVRLQALAGPHFSFVRKARQ